MKLKRNILSWLGVASLCLAVGMGVPGCTNEFEPGLDQSDLGQKIHGTLSIPLGPSSPVTVSRAVDFSDNAMVKIDCYWIGVYDSKTGELLGTKTDMVPRKSDGTRWTLRNDIDTPFTAEDIDIYYYEHNPYAYVVGVVNFNGVEGKLAGETENKPLKDLLEEAKTFSDVTKIVVDTKSADKANRDRGSDEACPVMMGFYSTARTAVHPMVNADGSIFVSPFAYPYLYPSADDNITSDVVVRLTGSGADLHLTGGAVRLQRLLADFTVRVIPSYYNDYYYYDYVNINSVEYMVVNKPLDVYLMEHATDMNVMKRSSKEDYLAFTANSADFTDNFLSDEYFSYANRYYDNQTRTYYYEFSFQQYENKHMGLPWWENIEDFYYYDDHHFLREKRFDDPTVETGKSGIYRSLCPSLDQPWNNNASFIILKVSFDRYDNNMWYNGENQYWGSDYQSGATIYYIIHEGYTSLPDGQDASIWGSSSYADYLKTLDFQTVRNTRYNYNVYIGGADGLRINVFADDYDSNYHNDGITGAAWYTTKEYLDNSSTNQYRSIGPLTDAQRKSLKWVYAEYTPHNRITSYWGTWTSEDGELYISNNDFYFDARYAKDPEDVNYPIPEGLMNAVRVTKTPWSGLENSKTLQEFIALESDDPWLELQEDEYFYYSFDPYFLSGDEVDYDKYSQYVRLFCLIQPESMDSDGCMIAVLDQYIQRAYDNRQSLGSFYGPDGYYNHDYGFGDIHNRSYYYNFNNNYQTYWCGAPGTVSWFYVRQYYNSGDPDMDVPDYDIRIGNQTFTVKSEDIFVDYTYSRYKYLRIPLYIPQNFSSYGFLTVTFTPKPDPSKYRPASSVTYENSIYMQRKRTSGEGRWQWLLANVSESTYGYGKIWEFYNFEDHIQSNFEYGGLTVICNKSDKAITTARHPLYDGDSNSSEVDCLNFSGGYGSNGAPSRYYNDQMLMKFWIDRPGDVYLSYGYANSGNNREWRAYWRTYNGNTRSTNYLHWAPDESKFGLIIPEEKGVPNTGSMEEFWPEVDPNTGRFVDGPIEVLIYMASSSGYIRSIEFRPNNN